MTTETFDDEVKSAEPPLTTFEKIALLLQQHFSISEELELNMAQKITLEDIEPTTPDIFESNEALLEIQSRIMVYKTLVHKREKTHEALIKMRHQNEHDLVAAMPYRNAWYKITLESGTFLVGYYSDDWGGPHSVVKIVKYNEGDPLPEPPHNVCHRD